MKKQRYQWTLRMLKLLEHVSLTIHTYDQQKLLPIDANCPLEK
jgi:hypothetical protein